MKQNYKSQYFTIEEAIEQGALNSDHVTSLEADFEKGTWTFTITDDVKVGAGDYIVMRLADWNSFMADLRASKGKEGGQ